MDLQSLYLDIGDKLFEVGCCEEALIYYQRAYEEESGQQEILARVSEQYILQEEANFKRYFDINCMIVDFSFNYEDCHIDFIPISDGKYVLFDKETARFCGSYDLESLESKQDSPKTFQSVLIADNWDAREVLNILRQNIWNNTYIVLNDSVEKFMSFFKLPGFSALLPKKVHIFSDTEKMIDFFKKNPNMYLPRIIYALEQERYKGIIEDIHQKRIYNGKHGNNVFLSICIPSYNRGKLALEAVQHALRTEYDSEIEILVSDNGSSIGKKEYEMIQDMRDSRVQYYQLRKNEGIAANICNCLKKATGHFAILLSDEEQLIVENLDQLLEYLWNNQELGGFKVPDGENAAGVTITDLNKFKTKRFSKGIEAINRAWMTCYVSGIGYNLKYLRQHDFLKKIDVISQNSYSVDVVYPHCTILVFLAVYYDIDNIAISVWLHMKDSTTGGYEALEDGGGHIKQFTLPENRLKQEISALRITENLLTFQDYKVTFLQRVNAIFSHVSELFLLYKKSLDLPYDWVDFHVMHYKNCLKILHESRWEIEAFDEVFFHNLDEVFFDWLDCRRIRSAYSEKENFKATLRAQMARYCYDQGVPFLEIDFRAIDESLETIIEQAVPGEKSI